MFDNDFHYSVFRAFDPSRRSEKYLLKLSSKQYDPLLMIVFEIVAIKRHVKKFFMKITDR